MFTGPPCQIGAPDDAQTGALEHDGNSILFLRDLTDGAMIRERSAGARFAACDGAFVPGGHRLLFRLRSDGRLAAVTAVTTPEPQPGDSVILFGPISTVPYVSSRNPT